MPAGGAQPLRVVGQDDERGRAQRGAAAQTDHDHRQLRFGRIREERLQRPGAGEQQAPVYVQERDLAAGKGRRRRRLDEVVLLVATEPDDRQIDGLLIELQQQGKEHAETDCGGHR